MRAAASDAMIQALLGPRVDKWVPPPRPGAEPILGRFAHLEVLSANHHAADLYPAFRDHDAVWDYMPDGPFSSAAQFYRWVAKVTAKDDVLFYAIRDLRTGLSAGVASYLRIAPTEGRIEVGNIAFAPALQKTPAATEAMFLMMQWAFEAGYRRYEWKCNALNMPSRCAAQRLGFSYEGIFRQATVIKGRNRDTAWFAIIDQEWPALQSAFQMWLDPQNFDASGCQKERLGNLTGGVRVASDPAL